LVIVGSLMATSAKDINWRYLGDSIPAFLTIAVMPFTYSIAYGLIAGICSYILINTLVYTIEKVSGGRIVPANKDEKEPWTWRLPGGFLPPWMQRLTSGKKDFWKANPETEGEPRSGGSSPDNVTEKGFVTEGNKQFAQKAL
jgi:AGZA family xanthine/uracil permease-like MFS transporter